MKYFLILELIIFLSFLTLLPLPGTSFEVSGKQEGLAGSPRANSAAGGVGLRVDDPPPAIVSASWYDEQHCLGCRQDLLMANGEKFDSSKFTAAFNDLPLGMKIKVVYQGKSVEVEITDRLGLDRIDLSRSAFERLDSLDKGIIEVQILK